MVFIWLGILLTIGLTCYNPLPHTFGAQVFPTNESSTKRERYLDATKAQGQEWLVLGSDKLDLHQALTDHYGRTPARRGWSSPRILLEHEISEEQLSHNIITLIGTPSNNSLIKKVQKNLPFSWYDSTLIFFNDTLFLQGHCFIAQMIPNPQNSNLPINIITALEDQDIIQYFTRTGSGWNRQPIWDYLLTAAKGHVFMGSFLEPGGPIDTTTIFDFRRTAIKVEHIGPFAIHHALPDYDYPYGPIYLDYLRQAWFKYKEWYKPKDNKLVNLFLYPDQELKGLAISNSSPVSVGSDENVHVVVSSAYEKHFCGQEFIQFFDSTLWPETLMAGLGAALSPQWFGHNLHYWAAKVQRSLDIKQMEYIINHASPSKLLDATVKGSFIAYIHQRGLHHSYQKRNSELHWRDSLRLEWQHFLSEQIISESTVSSDSFYRGFNFAHEGYGIVNGYGSRKSCLALKRVKNLQANAVAIIPYGFMASPQEAGPIRFSDRTGMETDESIIQSIMDAQALGLQIMLKPQLWIGSSWPGDLQMKNQTDWDTFFEHYRTWILHYALLAEAYQVDLFCAGVELSHSTIKQPEAWKKIISNIRSIYSGPVTYAANWGKEFEEFSFPESLDYLGLDCYYPWHRSARVSKRTLEKKFQKIVNTIREKSERCNKKVILTEIGFRSVKAPWVRPHADDNAAMFYIGDQALCYDIALSALHNEDCLKGLFVWKFPSHLDAPPANRDYSPAFKPAENVIKYWFGKS